MRGFLKTRKFMSLIIQQTVGLVVSQQTPPYSDGAETEEMAGSSYVTVFHRNHAGFGKLYIYSFEYFHNVKT